MLKYMFRACRLVARVVVTVMVSVQAWAACGETGVALQVLGSGGPFGVGRASAGYLVWVDGESRFMVDAGGGTFARFHEAGARMAELDLLALSHFHPDHASEVPALLWPRGATLRVSGPSGSAGFPSVNGFVEGLFGTDGVFRILNSRVMLDTVAVDVARSAPTEVLADGRVRIQGVGVPHGEVPTVGYRIDVGESSVAFSSDQNGSDPAFTDFVRGVDVLVVHFAGSEESAGVVSDLHAQPSVWGQMATDADVGRLVLSHLSANQDLDENVNHLRTRYRGALTVADDLLCVPLQ